jgi:hypothetical protein
MVRRLNVFLMVLLLVTMPFTAVSAAPNTNEKAIEKKIDELEKSLEQLDELGSVMDEAIIVDYTTHSLYQLRITVIDLHLDKNVENSLLVKVDVAMKKADKAGDFVLAGDELQAWNMLDVVENVLGAFDNEVGAQRGKKISEEDADVLISQSQMVIEGIDGGSLNLLAHIEEFDTRLSEEIMDEIDGKIEEIQVIVSELEALGAEVTITVEEHSPVVVIIGVYTLYKIFTTSQTAAMEAYALERAIVEQRGSELTFKERYILYDLDIVGAAAFKFPSVVKGSLKKAVEFALKKSLELPGTDELKEMKYDWLTRAQEEGLIDYVEGEILKEKIILIFGGEVLDAPILISPTDGAIDVSINPTFTWSSVTGANNYRLMVATNPSDLPADPDADYCPACLISDVTSSTSYTPLSSLAYSTTYYWQVRAFDDTSSPTIQGPFSSVSSFATEAPPPPSPEPIGTIHFTKEMVLGRPYWFEPAGELPPGEYYIEATGWYKISGRGYKPAQCECSPLVFECITNAYCNPRNDQGAFGWGMNIVGLDSRMHSIDYYSSRQPGFYVNTGGWIGVYMLAMDYGWDADAYYTLYRAEDIP